MTDINYPKQPSEIERIGVNYSDRLLSGEAVSSATYVITDPDDVDVTTAMTVADSGQISDEDGDAVDETASIRVREGSDGINYKLTIKATTSLGNVLEEDRPIIVREE